MSLPDIGRSHRTRNDARAAELLDVLKKIGVFLAFFLPAVAGAMYIYQTLTAPSVKLNGKVTHSSLVFPPDFWDSLIPPDSVLFSPDNSEDPNFRAGKRRAISDFVEYIRLGKYSNIVGAWIIDLVNEGNRPAERTKLVVPRGDFAMIEKRGEQTQFMEIDGSIAVGDIFPGEAPTVTVWTSFGLTDASWVQSFELRHAEGIGKLEYLGPSGAAGRFVDRNIDFIGLLVSLLATGLGVTMASGLLIPRVRRTLSEKSATDDNGGIE